MKLIKYFLLLITLCGTIFGDNSPAELALLPAHRIEITDPLHRYHSILKPAYMLWVEDWQDKYPEFNSFLESNRSMLELLYPKLYDPKFQLTWLNEVERTAYHATFKTSEEGSTTIFNPHFGELTDGKWIYILLKGEFYVGPEIRYQFHHTSLSAGANVEDAGTFTIEDRHLTAITLSSGHYRPSVIHGRQTVEALSKLGVDTSDLKISYTIIKDNLISKHKSTVKEFMEQDLQLYNDSSPLIGSTDSYLMEFTDLQSIKEKRTSLFLDTDNRLYMGNGTLDLTDPLCSFLSEETIQAFIKVRNGLITKLIFHLKINEGDNAARMAKFVKTLQDRNIELSGVVVEVIGDHTAQDLDFNVFLKRISLKEDLFNLLD